MFSDKPKNKAISFIVDILDNKRYEAIEPGKNYGDSDLYLKLSDTKTMDLFAVPPYQDGLTNNDVRVRVISKDQQIIVTVCSRALVKRILNTKCRLEEEKYTEAVNDFIKLVEE
jgi:hypothetical protein